ncbi:MAG: cation-translocating P-type ATPase [Mycobacterium sp.]
MPQLLSLHASTTEIEAATPAQDSAEPREAATRDGPAPGDGLLWAARTAMVGVNVAGLTIAVVGRTLRLPRAPIAIEAAVSLVSHQPWLRRVIEDRIGAGATDTALSLATTVAQTLTLSPAKLSVELMTQVFRSAERNARERAWARHAPALAGWADRPETSRPTRAVPASAGPEQRHGKRLAVVQAAGTGLVGAVTGSLDMAATAAVVTAPKALRGAREAFAATLGQRLADQDVALTLRPAAMSRLDTVDTLLVDPRVLCGADLQVVRLRGTRDGELSTAWSQAQQLLGQPDLAPGWHPLPGAAAANPGRRVVAEALVLPTHHRFASAAVAQARGSGVELSTVDLDILGELRPAFDDIRPVADGTADSVIDEALSDALVDLQRAGRVVAVLAAVGAPVLSGADVALGLMPATGDVPPERPDLLLFDLAGAWRVLHALPAAREASRNGMAISTGASAMGGLLMVPGVRAWRGPSPVTVGAAAGLLLGYLLARRVAGTPVPSPAPVYEWHAMSPQRVRQVLAEVEAQWSGPEPATPPSALWQFLRAVRAELDDPLTPVMALCSAATALLGSPIDAAIVGTALIGNAMIAATQQLRAESRLNRLLSHQTPPARTVTIGPGGRSAHQVVPVEALKPGDVIEVRSNEVVPADARMIEETDLEVDESSLTGESLPVGKQVDATPGADLADRHCMLHAGTTVVAGTAVAIVTAVGADTNLRRAAELAAGDRSEVGLQRQLGELASRAFPASFAGGAVVGVLGLLRGGGLQQGLGNAIAVAVAAIPEGLPLMATLAQYASARRLSGTGALVRVPRSVEALGRLDVVCFDKTGTLSQNRLRVTGVHPVSGASRDDVLRCAAQASPSPDSVQHAHATDRAIIAAAAAAGCASSTDDLSDLAAHLPFRSGRAFSASVSGTQLSVKGAPEVVLAACGDVAAGVENTVNELAAAGLRVIAVAGRHLDEQQLASLRENPADIVGLCGTDLALTGFLGLADTPRAQSPKLLADLAARGLAVRLITGDHPVTATAIAAELGMGVPVEQVITGAEWNALSRKEQEHAVGERVIFARMSPQNKVQVVQALKRSGRVCAMVGDGANDAAAIRTANVGIGVVTRGSDAAHATADIVLTDGRIDALVDAIDEGRRLWRGVQAAVAGLLGGNAGEVIFTVIGSALTGNTPLNARQLLLMNMITDALPATAVAASIPAGPAEPAGRGLDEQTLWRAVAVRGAITATAGTAAWAMARVTGRAQRAATVALIALVCVELGQMLVDSRAPLVVVTAAGSFAVFVAMVNTPILSQLLGCTPIGPFGWAQGLGSAGAAVAALAILKRWGRRHGLPVG